MRVAVIGGGVVGLTVLRSLARRGAGVTLLERGASVLTGASGGNSGILCTGYDAEPGSLERRLLHESLPTRLQTLDALNVPYRRTGSLVVDWGGQAEDLRRLEATVRAADDECALLSREELLAREPGLAAHAQGALLIAGETLVDPWLLPTALARDAVAAGGAVQTGFDVSDVSRHGHWRLTAADGRCVEADVVVNCAGNYADAVERLAHGLSWFEARPRVGHYLVFQRAGAPPLTAPIQPVPSSRTKGVFVFKSLHGNVVVGPTAEDVHGRDAPARPPADVLRALRAHGEAVLPGLADCAVAGTYSGVRPGTDDRDYRISGPSKTNWVTVAGVRSTGVSASLGIGEHVAECVFPGRRGSPGPPACALPPLEEIKASYSASDGTVLLDGERRAVTHPLSRFGLSP